MTQMPQSLNGLQVLVVDDEAGIQESITVVLGSYGMNVKAVASEAAALEVLKPIEQTPVLIGAQQGLVGEIALTDGI